MRTIAHLLLALGGSLVGCDLGNTYCGSDASGFTRFDTDMRGPGDDCEVLCGTLYKAITSTTGCEVIDAGVVRCHARNICQ